MVYVPEGEFLMGSTDADQEALPDEKPQHKVTLDAFWIDKTEVTNAQYRHCVEAGVCQVPTSCDFGEPTYAESSMIDHPVVCMSWDYATAYCTWAGARLPTEAEWEKAARGTDGRVFPWGNEEPDCQRADVSGCVGPTRVVGSYPNGASPYGALDMAGNASEWVADWYGETYYASSQARNPLGPDSGQFGVLRGGSWREMPYRARAASRDMEFRTGHVVNYGFRCATSAGE